MTTDKMANNADFSTLPALEKWDPVMQTYRLVTTPRHEEVVKMSDKKKNKHQLCDKDIELERLLQHVNQILQEDDEQEEDNEQAKKSEFEFMTN